VRVIKKKTIKSIAAVKIEPMRTSQDSGSSRVTVNWSYWTEYRSSDDIYTRSQVPSRLKYMGLA